MKHLLRNSALGAARSCRRSVHRYTAGHGRGRDRNRPQLRSYRPVFQQSTRPPKSPWISQLAEINAAGGINGKKVRIVKFDTAGDPKQAVVAVRKFAQ